MFIRILGRIFFLFYICPFLRQVFAIAAKVIMRNINKEITKMEIKEREDRARSRRNHPAGSRLPRQ